jgi:hypothetical protein
MKRKQCKKAVLVFIVIFSFMLVGIGGVFSSSAIAKEIGPNEVQGKVLSIRIGAFARGIIDVKSDRTGTTYTFYVGKNTMYNPPRYPAVGETIKVRYINDRGRLKATSVEIIEGLK